MPTQILAKPQLTLKPNISTYTDFKVETYREALDENIGIEKISKLKFSDKTDNSFAFGYHENNYWFHFFVSNDSVEAKSMVLEFTEIIHKTLDLYEVSSDHIKHSKNGLRIPVEERDIKEATPSFPLNFKPNETKEFYINLSTVYSVMGAIHIKTKEQYNKDLQSKNNFHLIYISIVMTIVLYNLILFLYLREKIYFLYAGHIFVFLLWAMNYKGVLLNYTGMAVYDMLQTTVPIAFIFLILFSQSILSTKKHFPTIDKILYYLIYICLFTIVLMLVSISYGFYFMNIVSSPSLAFLFFVAFWALVHKLPVARLYIVALFVYIFGLSLLSLLALGFFPYSILLSYSATMGSLVEIIFFSLLLAFRISVANDKTKALKEELVYQKELERTRLDQLEDKLDRKDHHEKELRQLASTDEMTGMLNRRAFFELADMEVIKSSGIYTTFACLIIDIDHFKKVNDTYGHNVGDVVIKNIAKIILSDLGDENYIGRIGGEEFAIILPNARKITAIEYAERLKNTIALFKTSIDDISLSITVSIGVSLSNHNEDNIQSIMKRADIALYEAKNNGRNKVCYI